MGDNFYCLIFSTFITIIRLLKQKESQEKSQTFRIFRKRHLIRCVSLIGIDLFIFEPIVYYLFFAPTQRLDLIFFQNLEISINYGGKYQ